MTSPEREKLLPQKIRGNVTLSRTHLGERAGNRAPERSSGSTTSQVAVLGDVRRHEEW